MLLTGIGRAFFVRFVVRLFVGLQLFIEVVVDGLIVGYRPHNEFGNQLAIVIAVSVVVALIGARRFVDPKLDQFYARHAVRHAGDGAFVCLTNEVLAFRDFFDLCLLDHERALGHRRHNRVAFLGAFKVFHHLGFECRVRRAVPLIGQFLQCIVKEMPGDLTSVARRTGF